MLAPDEIRAGWPYLRTDDLVSATYSPRDGFADPYLVTTAIAARARELGVIIKTEHPVIGIERRAAGVTSVRTPQGDFEAPVVVIAAGCWSGEVGKLAGAEHPGLSAPPEQVHHRALSRRPDPAGNPVHHRPSRGSVDPARRRGNHGRLRAKGGAQLLRHAAGLGAGAGRGGASHLAHARSRRRSHHARVGGSLRDDARPDGHHQRGAGPGRSARGGRVQRPRLHARPNRRPAHGRADRRRAGAYGGHRAARYRTVRARRGHGRGDDLCARTSSAQNGARSPSGIGVSNANSTPAIMRYCPASITSSMSPLIPSSPCTAAWRSAGIDS